MSTADCATHSQPNYIVVVNDEYSDSHTSKNLMHGSHRTNTVNLVFTTADEWTSKPEPAKLRELPFQVVARRNPEGPWLEGKAAKMLIGERLRELREAKNFSQGEVEKRTGLLRCYTSRVENGHTVPSIETLEKYARALEVPMYTLFYEGQGEPKEPLLPLEKTESGRNRKTSRELQLFVRLLARMKEADRAVLLAMAQGMARRKRTA